MAVHLGCHPHRPLPLHPLWQWILSSATFNFPYPIALTLLHMLFSTVLCFLAVRVFKVHYCPSCAQGQRTDVD